MLMRSDVTIDWKALAQAQYKMKNNIKCHYV